MPLTVQLKNISPIKINLMYLDKTQHSWPSPKKATTKHSRKYNAKNFKSLTAQQYPTLWYQSSQCTSMQQRNLLTFILLT